ncbi:uncharacterized protein ATNIH1004_009123 [Aspergillus tanneri]|uniref:D-serine dehydratase n=1 Tax=Aspergillus tanneri TaxID=1220188 RepID=A0A5M9MD44_9EURO|nr:uncharacterized protein ATNIH1004_009123 [Aspergillus tanneri]KAA8644912.1 hypothetical protein ATNIH1004_009123 [Aspergillus tanneri]
MATGHLSEEDLKALYIGKDIANLPRPCAVLDAAILRRNCDKMRRAMKALNVGFRAHVKTHKTWQVTQLQMGEENTDVNLVASTVNEIEHLVVLLKDFKAKGRRINVLYGIPLVPSQVPRLAQLACELGEGSISVMIDHPDQLSYLERFSAITHFPACVFLKVDTGYHRAGLPPIALNKNGLLEKLADAEKLGFARLLGVYSHSSLSYSGTTPQQAMAHLTSEIIGCRDAVQHHQHLLPHRKLVLSVGATPQAAAMQNLVQERKPTPETKALKDLLRCPLPSTDLEIELHAGNYAVLDMQQLETNADARGNPEEEIAISVIAEVCSLYNDGERSRPEALLAAGTLALGREPCHSYSGWGVVGNWRRATATPRLIVGRISQEHSIVSWEMESDEIPKIPLEISQAVRIYPNHACITGAMYGWYWIVDSSLDDGSKIVDVWMRASGYRT